MARSTPKIDAEGLYRSAAPAAVPSGSPGRAAWPADERRRPFRFLYSPAAPRALGAPAGAAAPARRPA